MALVLKDRIKETTSTSGTGTYTLAGAETGFEAFSTIGDGNTTYYCCTDGTDFEIGVGTYTLSGTTLARTTILQSSNSDSAVNWGSGSSRTIFCTYPADKSVFLNASGEMEVSGKITADAGIDIDNFNIDGTTIALSSGDMTIDSAGDIVIDADGANVTIKDNGTSILDIANNSSDVELTVSTADKNFKIKGTDGSSGITALDIDMALNGKATFSGDVVVTGDLTVTGDDIVMGTNTAGHILVADGTNFNPTAVGDLSEISTVATDDVLLAVDTSGGGLKKITRATLVAGLATSSGISNIVEDTSPQLGGDLDMNGQDIVTTSNATIDLAPNGTGTVVVRGNTNSGRIVFNCESNSHGQTLASQPHSAAVTNTMLLPAGSSSTLVSLVSTDTLTNKSFGDDVVIKTADGAILKLQTSDTTVADGDVVGAIEFSAPDEAGGTDAITTAASIVAEADATFAADNNQTDLVFKLGSSEAATEKMRLTHEGDLSVGNDVNLTSDSSVLKFGADGDTSLTHTDGTGLTLNSTNKLTFGDAASFIQQSTDGTLRIDGEAIIDLNASTRVDVSGDLKVGGEVQTANIGFTDGDNAITIADGGGITAAAGITSTAASNTFGATSFNDANITNVGSIALDSIASDAGVGTAITFGAGNVPNTLVAGSQTGNITPDMSQYTNFILTLTGNIVLQDPGDEVAGQSGVFVFIQDGTGSRTLSHADDRYFVAGGTSITLSTAANAKDIVPYFVEADGTIYLGAAQKAFAEA